MDPGSEPHELWGSMDLDRIWSLPHIFLSSFKWTQGPFRILYLNQLVLAEFNSEVLDWNLEIPIEMKGWEPSVDWNRRDLRLLKHKQCYHPRVLAGKTSRRYLRSQAWSFADTNMTHMELLLVALGWEHNPIPLTIITCWIVPLKGATCSTVRPSTMLVHWFSTNSEGRVPPTESSMALHAIIVLCFYKSSFDFNLQQI